MKELKIIRLQDCTIYKEILDLQLSLNQKRKEDNLKDTILFLEHKNTITLGNRGTLQDILISEDERKNLDIDLEICNRGGEVTLHSPGQLVIYFILDTSNYKLRDFIEKIKSITLYTLIEIGLKNAYSSKEHHGIWIDNKKISSVGIALKRKISMHGVSININNDLNYFNYIVPCGIKDKKQTSLSRELNKHIEIEELIKIYINNFVKIFDYKKVEYDN